MLCGARVCRELGEHRGVAKELAEAESLCTVTPLIGLFRVDDLLETLPERGTILDLEPALVRLDGLVVSPLSVESRTFTRVALRPCRVDFDALWRWVLG